VQSLPGVEARPLGDDPSGQVFEGPPQSRPALILLSEQFDPRWRLETEAAGRSIEPIRAFGWATGFRTDPAPSGYRIHFGGQRVRTVQVILLILLWGAALWATRRPVRSD
jgi:hypothetical protein